MSHSVQNNILFVRMNLSPTNFFSIITFTATQYVTTTNCEDDLNIITLILEIL